MTAEQAKSKGYTHHGKLYGVQIYLADTEECEVVGTNWLNDQFLAFFIWFDVNFTHNEHFAIFKGPKL